MPSWNMSLLQAIARTAERDALAASGRKALGMATDPTSQLKRLAGRLLSGDGEIYEVNRLAQVPKSFPKIHNSPDYPEFHKALQRLGETYERRLGYARKGAIGAGLAGAGALGASTIGIPKGVDMAKRRMGETVEKGLPQVPLVDRLGFALKSIFAPASAGHDINTLLNR